jgi:S1-C subfamily serine protease
LRRAVGLPDRDGILVRGVEEDSPADEAGIREGDLIVSAGGTPVEDPDGLHAALAKAGSGKLDVGLVRGVEELTISVDLGGPASTDGEATKKAN